LTDPQTAASIGFVNQACLEKTFTTGAKPRLQNTKLGSGNPMQPWACMPSWYFSIHPRSQAGEYSFLHLVEFIEALADVIPNNGTSLKVYNHLRLPPRELPRRSEGGDIGAGLRFPVQSKSGNGHAVESVKQPWLTPPARSSAPTEFTGNQMLLSTDAVLESRALAHHVEALLTKSTALFVETGDAWFHGQKMTLPDDCGYGVCLASFLGHLIGSSIAALFAYLPRQWHI
jgi:hypothetical protein